ncbi:hypothetical protein DMA11_21525 [Marinilabiliaceae bacterium JC017]|nr:hypothetical protein DMA11_21525 [Marinilabiliaceae bacterium JC017]
MAIREVKKRTRWQRFKKKWLDYTMDFKIGCMPKSLEKTSIAANGQGGMYEELSDEIIRIDDDDKVVSFWIGGAIIAFAFFILITSLKDFSNDDLYFILVILFLGLLSILYGYTVPYKEIVLDRKNGLFTFPNSWYGKPYTIPFEKAVVGWNGIGGISGAVDAILVVKHPNKMLGVSRLESHCFDYRQTWSLFVWYMDKNRPLPPGSAFDPYRQKDFERRKAEGFPSPLYPSAVFTPEATPEQQAERDKYWNEYGYASVNESDLQNQIWEWYNPRIHKYWRRVLCLDDSDKPVTGATLQIVFPDGKVIYTQGDKKGRVYMPPDTEKYEHHMVIRK